ncbi:MAG: class I SAM-dependent methyltransferase [Saprospiraceae bacterium]|nr:class I SAM-dependent methyltransferase [Saprospiraceae bacterium]
MLEFIKRQLPIGYLNYYRFLKNLFATNGFKSERLPGIFDEIIQTNYWKGSDSICGATSGVAATSELRTELQQLFTNLNIRSVLDIPCGDFVWMKEMDLSAVQYTGADIVQTMVDDNNRRYAAPNIHFECLDLTHSDLPRVDLVLCRDCLVHLSFEHIRQAILNLKKSGSTWLLCTSFVENRFNYDIKDGLWRTLNMQKAPFCFPNPVKTMIDNRLLEDSVFSDKTLCLWRLDDIKIP